MNIREERDYLSCRLEEESLKVEAVARLAAQMTIMLAVCNDLMRQMVDELSIDMPEIEELEQ